MSPTPARATPTPISTICTASSATATSPTHATRYNQQCFVASTASMFIFGGCGPGWGDIRPTCVIPPDCWSYSLAANRWSELYAGKGTPGGYAMACCYDAKRDVVWAYGHESRLSRFDLKTKRWSPQPVHPEIDYLGTYNFHMLYLPKSDRLLIVGRDTATIDPDTFAAERHPLDNADRQGRLGVSHAAGCRALRRLARRRNRAGLSDVHLRLRQTPLAATSRPTG